MVSISYIQALLVVIVPLLPLLIPAIAFIPVKKSGHLLVAGTRILAGSMAITTLTALLGAALGISPTITLVELICVTILVAIYRRRTILIRDNLWRVLAIIIPVVCITALFSIPFLVVKQGLPTGDSQKAIFWADIIRQTGHLPHYSIAASQLNRDPVDFYTPGLHALTAIVETASPQPLTNVGLFAIVVAVAVAWITAALSYELFTTKKQIIPPLIATLLVITNIRFLRYIREPGYHFQNVVGEFFLFALVYFGIRLIKKWNWQDAILAILTGISLILSHQFSAFIGFFATVICIIALAIRYRANIKKYIWHHTAAMIPIGLLIAMATMFAISLGLQRKIPQLFTASPHLLPLTPNPLDYPTLMGSVWFFAAVTGLILFTLHTWKSKDASAHRWAFIGITAFILLCSQGPRVFLDIPPVRSLFYTAVPLSITAAYGITLLWRLAQTITKQWLSYTVTGILAVVLAVTMIGSTTSAFSGSSRDVRTNSTLAPEQLTLIDIIKSHAVDSAQAILTDDYDHRSTSWFLLSGQPTYARIAADLERQMEEAGQSTKRRNLYFEQLDYEKIFSLASQPIAAQLMQQRGIAWVTGIDNTSNSGFEHNPALTPVASADHTTIYAVKPNATNTINANSDWLLKPATLVNDIGDTEDTLEHLPAAIRTANISDPQFDGRRTFRITTAPVIPLAFNVDDYTRILWDKDNNKQPDSALDLLVQFATEPPPGLSIQTSDGSQVKITDKSAIRIPANHIRIDDKGFVTIQLINPNEEPVAIDLIALGVSQVP